MIAKFCKVTLLLFICTFYVSTAAQTSSITSKIKKIEFYELRGIHTVDFGAGTSVMNGDLVDPKFEISFHAGYKYFIFPHLNINIGYNKFNLAYVDVYNEGFMSFDLNLESILCPHNRFSPFVFAGGGYNASNYFEQTAMKIQGGGGIETIVAEGIGIKLYADYNYVMSDELDGVIAGASDDTYYRIGLGINYYFGGKKRKEKILKDQPSIINSNKIILDN